MEIPIKHIATKSLHLNLIPKQDAPFIDIMAFGASFHGYEYWGSIEECGKIANNKQHNTITELRTCLFFEGRRWRHFGETPDEEAQKYWRELVGKIREKFAAGEYE